MRLRKGEHSLEVDNTRRDIAGGFGFVAFRRGPSPNTRWTEPGRKWYVIYVFQSARMLPCRLSVI